jgi:squalene-hopene/tetraprenyl-beta-curcumene cyclase
MIFFAAGIATTAMGQAQAPAAPDTKAAMQRGFDWLQAQQKANGSWSDENYPALTALGLWAFANGDSPARTAVCARAAAFIAGFVQEDGGIYKKPSFWRRGGLSVYNTAICMTALHAYDRQRYASVILKARTFIATNQFQGASAGSNAGGFGYDRPGAGMRSRADLSNTGWALMAMRATQGLEDQRASSEKHADVDWAAAASFASKLQNQDATDTAHYGGFGYNSVNERGSPANNRSGATKLVDYGSMTYAGLESMLYAQVSADDPRVRSAIAWAARHWSVTENPGQGSKGLYYYYTIMAKALALAGSDNLPAGSGRAIAWRNDLATQLLKTQQADGSWRNEDNTFWENDPALVTSYVLLALEKCAAK